jgi:hypothetical protein
MVSNITQSHIDLYGSSRELNYQDIRTIIQDLKIDNHISHEDFEFFINSSIDNLINKWKSGRKILRTDVARSIINDYPHRMIRPSIILDATINLLDDLFDEKMNKEEKGLYIIELLRINAVLMQENLSKTQDLHISNYYNKLLCIAIPEFLYKEKILNSDNIDDIVLLSMQCYDCKSMDMDIFMELPLSELKYSDEIIKDIVELARIHRALILIRKDIIDIDHDKRMETITPMVILNEREEFQNIISTIINNYHDRISKISKTPYSDNIMKLINDDSSELISFIILSL